MAKIIVCPIRLIFGISRDNFYGFALVYERSDGSAGHRDVWFSNDKKGLMSKIRFVSSGESRIVWEVSRGMDTPVLKEIVIRRDAQIKTSRKGKPPADNEQPI